LIKLVDAYAMPMRVYASGSICGYSNGIGISKFDQKTSMCGMFAEFT